jgi:hypothetical protein
MASLFVVIILDEQVDVANTFCAVVPAVIAELVATVALSPDGADP